MRRALITGSTGFIGGRLALRLLDDGWAIGAITRSGSDGSLLPADIARIDHTGDVACLKRAIATFRPDCVFHLASLYVAEHQPAQVAPLVASNILFTAELAEAMTQAGVACLVNTGTAWQHFDTSGYRPVNLYAATKQAADDLLRFYHDAHGLSAITLTLFDSYGPGDTRRKLVQILVDAALTGEPLGMSPGMQQIDLTHVDDIAAAFIVAADRMLGGDAPRWEHFFVGGRRLTVRALAALVGTALDVPLQPRFGTRPYRRREVMRPPAADPLLPGWRPTIDLTDGIRALARS